jgi:hypothetical protein
MNERIDELMIQSGARFEFLHGVHYDDFQYKTFAELIVRECVAICQDVDGEDNIDARSGRQDCAVEIREHFGVEQ